MLEFPIDIRNLPFNPEDKTLSDVGMEPHVTPSLAPEYIGISKKNREGFVPDDSVYLRKDGSNYEIHIAAGDTLDKEQIAVCLNTFGNYIRGMHFARHKEPVIRIVVDDDVATNDQGRKIQNLIAVLNGIKTGFF